MSPLAQLKHRLAEVSDLGKISAILHWDSSTYMPSGGAASRARHLALLDRLAHSKFTDLEVGKLIEQCEKDSAVVLEDPQAAAYIKLARKEYDQCCKIPGALVSERSEHFSNIFALWQKARPANKFVDLVEPLKRSIDLSRRTAACFPGYKNIADPLIEFSDPGMTTTDIQAVFSKLQAELVPLIKSVTNRGIADDSCLLQDFPVEAQANFGLAVAKAYGYDIERGRQDQSAHPFSITFAIGDVRITSRFKVNDLSDGLFSTLHETGHALYEQGNDPAYDGNIFQGGVSSGVHESQSRLWENIVGRSLNFWKYFYPKLQTVFPDQLRNVSLEHFYNAINKVSPSLIRTEADELTYNLHVIIRFQIEIELLEGRLTVEDLPEYWNTQYHQALGVSSKTDSDGVMQDCHWFNGYIGGAFQGYTIGNILSAQFFDAALKAHPEILKQIELGNFKTLHAWLKNNIYRHGRSVETKDLIQAVCGSQMDVAAYVKYLKDKYAELPVTGQNLP